MNELELAKVLAVEAGAILLNAFHKSSPVRWKGLNSPVTDADMSASSLLVGAIRKHFPEDGILCEETTDDLNRLTKPRVWIIDPMDGTSEFVAHVGEFAVMIGLAIHGKPVLGVVYQPTEATLLYGESGSGAFLEHPGQATPQKLSAAKNTEDLVAAVSRSNDSTQYESVRQALGINRIVHSGSAGLKIGMICQKRADLYVHTGPETNQWDTCAPEVILHEAGGRLTDMFNAPLRYNVSEPRHLQGIVASNGVIHEQIIKAAQRSVR